MVPFGSIHVRFEDVRRCPELLETPPDTGLRGAFGDPQLFADGTVSETAEVGQFNRHSFARRKRRKRRTDSKVRETQESIVLDRRLPVAIITGVLALMSVHL